MTAFDAEFGADIWEPRPHCRETRKIYSPDGVEECPGCDDCCPDIPDDELQRAREERDATFDRGVKAWFRKTEAAA